MENPKIKDEELKQIIDDQNELQKMLSQVGVLEAQKKQLLDVILSKSNEIEKFKAELEKEYGKISINLKDGSYEVIKDETPAE
jgi:predicted RNase H-like nuclease (RuvC/YqgF family)